MKDILCKNIEEINKIVNILIRKGYSLEKDFYSEPFMIEQYGSIYLYLSINNTIDWLYIHYDNEYISANQFITELRTEKLKRING